MTTATPLTAAERYNSLWGAAASVLQALRGQDDPSARFHLLNSHADLSEAMAKLYPIAYRGRCDEGHDPSPSVARRAAEASLCRLVASTEHALTLSTWAPASSLRKGQPLMLGRRSVVVTRVEPNAFNEHLLHVHYGDDDDAESFVLYRDDTVRTAGPASLAIEKRTRDAGADEEECGLWYQLATTRDREYRAELLCELARVATSRVGKVAELLYRLADTEAHVSSVVGTEGR